MIFKIILTKEYFLNRRKENTVTIKNITRNSAENR